jgi:hypothetical protein
MLSHPLDFFAHTFLPSADNIFIEPLCVKGMARLIQADLDRQRHLKNGFAASQKSFPLRERPAVILIPDKPLTSGGHDGVVSPSTENIEFAACEPFFSGYARLSDKGSDN